MTNQNQKGFTLIELMIVVAIIGILASVAIPQYAVYIGRTEFGSAVASCDELKAGVGEYVSTKGPADGSTVTTAAVTSLRPDLSLTATDYASKYSTGCALGAGGIITLTFPATGVSSDLVSQTIVMTPTVSGGRIEKWEAVTTIDAKYIPEALR